MRRPRLRVALSIVAAAALSIFLATWFLVLDGATLSKTEAKAGHATDPVDSTSRAIGSGVPPSSIEPIDAQPSRTERSSPTAAQPTISRTAADDRESVSGTVIDTLLG